MKKKLIWFFIRFFISSAIIGYTLNILSDKYGGLGNGLSHFAGAFTNASLNWLIPAFLLHFIGMALMSFRWKILLKGQGVDAGYGSLYSFNMMAAFFNNFLPSTIGGDVVKAVESKKFTGDHTTSFMVIFVERLTGLISLALIALTAFVIRFAGGSGGNEEGNPLFFIIAIILGITMVIIISYPTVSGKVLKIFSKILPKKLNDISEKGFAALSAYFKYPLLLLSSLGISLVFQFNMVLYYYFISRSLGQSPDFIDFMSKAPMLIFLLMTVPSVNGIGVRTAVFGGLMKFPAASALACEVIDIGMRMLLGLFGGVFFLFHKRTGSGKDKG
ncbi:MAG: lysylphosphatidylglycerol synthase transmembrane domain-containing protein [Acidobacteriota bacterium]